MRALVAGLATMALSLHATAAFGGECDAPPAEWLACEDFEGGGAGWDAWFAASPFVQCNGCPNGTNDPARIRLTNAPGEAFEGDWALHMPAEASANYQGASLAFRSCAGQKTEGCPLVNHEQLYFRTWVKLASDHQLVHHFLSVAGTRADAFWESDGNAGCRPNGVRWAGTTLDFNDSHELFFYTYYPEMNCDSGGYCSGSYAQDICDGCATKDMPCVNGLECCWGNHFPPRSPVVLARDQWVCLELMMRLNTPGASDGEMAFWVDEAPGAQVTNMHWRDVAELGLNKAWLQHYIAAGDATQSNRVWFDNVVVSTARIGCGGGPPPSATAAGATSGAGASAAGAGGSASPAAAPAGSDGGCGCRLAPRPTSSAWPALALLLLASRRQRPIDCRRPPSGDVTTMRR